MTWKLDMNSDQRQTALIHDPMGRWLPTSLAGEKPKEIQGLKGTSPLGDTQVARAEGKLPGLSRLMEMSAESDAGAPKPAPWQGDFTVPEPPSHNVRNMAVGISGGVVAGVLACVLAMNYIRNVKAEHSPQPLPLVQDVSQAATPEVKASETDQQKSADEKQADSGSLLASEGGELPGESTLTPQIKSRLAPEVLFRLDLSLEQSDRIRTILERCSKDLPFAEEQIHGLLTEEQNRRWQSIAP
jgi:hypothetical protein